MAQLRWWVKLVAERPSGVVTETELACIERDEQIGLAELGLRLDEAKQVTKSLQAEMVPAQMTALGEGPRARGVRAQVGEQGMQRGSARSSAACRCGCGACWSARTRGRAAGPWQLQRKVLPSATVVLDRWRDAVRSEHALQVARSPGAGTAEASLAATAGRALERAK